MTSDFSTKIAKVKNALEAVFVKKSDLSNYLTRDNVINSDVITNIELVPYNTDNTGVVCFTHSPIVLVQNTISLATDTNVLSYYNSQSATLTATLLDANNDPLPNESVEFFKGTTSLGNATTNNDGIATKTYSSNGDGDLSFTVKYGNTTSDAVTIEDCYYFNDGTVNNIVSASGTTITVENGALKVTTSSSSEKKFYFPTNSKFSSSANVEFSYECARETNDSSGHAQIVGLSLNPSNTVATQGYCSYTVSSNDTGGYWSCSFNNDSFTSNVALAKGDKIKLVREGGSTKLYQNDNLLRSVSRSVSDFYFGGYTNQNRIQRFKNIKIKKL